MKKITFRASSFPFLLRDIDWVSKKQIYRNIILNYHGLPSDPILFKKPIDHGNKYESHAIEKIEIENGILIRNKQLAVFKNVDNKYIIQGHIDGDYVDFEGKKVLVEVKCPYLAHKRDSFDFDDYCNKYNSQVQAYMHLGGYDYCNFYVYLKDKVNDDILLKRIYKSKKFNFKFLDEHYKNLTNILSNLDDMHNQYYIKDLDELSIDIPEELTENYNHVCKEISDLLEIKNDLKQSITEFMERSEYIKGQNEHISAFYVTRDTVDYKSLIDDLGIEPDQLDKYKSSSNHLVIRSKKSEI